MASPSPDHDSAKPPIFHERRGGWVVVAVVSMGLGVSLLGVSAPWTFYAAVAGVTALLLALMLFVGDRLPPGRSRLAHAVYFSALLGLGATLAFLFAGQGLFGVVWLVFMPLVAQARMLLPAWGTTLVCVASLGILGAHSYALWGWGEVPGTVTGLTTAVIFVLLFTDFALRESEARAESQRLGAELKEANETLSDYAVQAEDLAMARERSRVAREIHDSLGHVLTALNMQIEAARALFDREPGTVRDHLDKAQGLARQGLSEVRRSVAALRASPLEGRRLEEVLSELAARNAGAGVATRLEVRGEVRALEPRAELTLYRTAQEGLTNALKHARAGHVDLVLDYRAPDRVRLEVRDDGVGNEGPDGRDGFGLLGVRERVRQLDGRCEVRSSPGRGLTLEVEIPA